jgi:amino acid permease
LQEEHDHYGFNVVFGLGWQVLSQLEALLDLYTTSVQANLIAQMGPSVILLYAIGGLVIWTVMQSFAELLVNVPRQGNFISHTAEFISPTWAVGTGWRLLV